MKYLQGINLKVERDRADSVVMFDTSHPDRKCGSTINVATVTATDMQITCNIFTLGFSIRLYNTD